MTPTLAPTPAPTHLGGVGEVVSFEELYSRHFRLVWSVLQALGVDRATREDVAQDAWTLIYRKRHLLRADASQRAWVAAMARGVAQRYRRTRFRRARRETAFGDSQPLAAESPAARVEAEHEVERLLTQLNPEQRLVYALVHGYGMSAREVAEVTGVSPNTVSSRLRLARRSIQALLDTERDTPILSPRALRAHPPEGARQRIGARLGFLPAAWTLTAAAVLKPLAAALVLGLGSVAFASAPADSPQPPASHPTTQASSSGPAHERRAAAVTQPAPPPELPAPTVEDRAPRARTQGTHPSRSDRRHRLRDEAALLFRARSALTSQHPRHALRLAAHHAKAFPDSSLADARAGVRIQALCELKRDDDARRVAHKQEVPTAIAEVALRSCGDET